MNSAITALEKALNWVEQNRNLFRPSLDSHNTAYVDAFKPLSEFVLAMVLVRDFFEPAKEHAKWAWHELHQGDELLKLLMARPDLIDLCSLIWHFRSFGFQNLELDRWIAHMANLNSTCAVETAIWCRVANTYYLSRLNIFTRQSVSELAEHSWLWALPEPWVIHNASLYSFTHIIFYLTEFGIHQHLVPSDVTEYCRLWIPVWMTCMAKERNYDLLAELVMCANYLRLYDGVPEATSLLVAVQRPSGCLANGLPNDNTPSFFNSYHSTLVAIRALQSTTVWYNGGFQKKVACKEDE